jgi:hypothetical protein
MIATPILHEVEVADTSRNIVDRPYHREVAFWLYREDEDIHPVDIEDFVGEEGPRRHHQCRREREREDEI